MEQDEKNQNEEKEDSPFSFGEPDEEFSSDTKSEEYPPRNVEQQTVQHTPLTGGQIDIRNSDNRRQVLQTSEEEQDEFRRVLDLDDDNNNNIDSTEEEDDRMIEEIEEEWRMSLPENQGTASPRSRAQVSRQMKLKTSQLMSNIPYVRDQSFRLLDQFEKHAKKYKFTNIDIPKVVTGSLEEAIDSQARHLAKQNNWFYIPKKPSSQEILNKTKSIVLDRDKAEFQNEITKFFDLDKKIYIGKVKLERQLECEENIDSLLIFFFKTKRLISDLDYSRIKGETIPKTPPEEQKKMSKNLEIEILQAELKIKNSYKTLELFLRRQIMDENIRKKIEEMTKTDSLISELICLRQTFVNLSLLESENDSENDSESVNSSSTDEEQQRRRVDNTKIIKIKNLKSATMKLIESVEKRIMKSPQAKILDELVMRHEEERNEMVKIINSSVDKHENESTDYDRNNNNNNNNDDSEFSENNRTDIIFRLYSELTSFAQKKMNMKIDLETITKDMNEIRKDRDDVKTQEKKASENLLQKIFNYRESRAKAFMISSPIFYNVYSDEYDEYEDNNRLVRMVTPNPMDTMNTILNNLLLNSTEKLSKYYEKYDKKNEVRVKQGAPVQFNLMFMRKRLEQSLVLIITKEVIEVLKSFYDSTFFGEKFISAKNSPIADLLLKKVLYRNQSSSSKNLKHIGLSKDTYSSWSKQVIGNLLNPFASALSQIKSDRIETFSNLIEKSKIYEQRTLDISDLKTFINFILDICLIMKNFVIDMRPDGKEEGEDNDNKRKTRHKNNRNVLNTPTFFEYGRVVWFGLSDELMTKIKKNSCLSTDNLISSLVELIDSCKNFLNRPFSTSFEIENEKGLFVNMSEQYFYGVALKMNSIIESWNLFCWKLEFALTAQAQSKLSFLQSLIKKRVPNSNTSELETRMALCDEYRKIFRTKKLEWGEFKKPLEKFEVENVSLTEFGVYEIMKRFSNFSYNYNPNPSQHSDEKNLQARLNDISTSVQKQLRMVAYENIDSSEIIEIFNKLDLSKPEKKDLVQNTIDKKTYFVATSTETWGFLTRDATIGPFGLTSITLLAKTVEIIANSLQNFYLKYGKSLLKTLDKLREKKKKNNQFDRDNNGKEEEEEEEEEEDNFPYNLFDQGVRYHKENDQIDYLSFIGNRRNAIDIEEIVSHLGNIKQQMYNWAKTEADAQCTPKISPFDAYLVKSIPTKDVSLGDISKWRPTLYLAFIYDLLLFFPNPILLEEVFRNNPEVFEDETLSELSKLTKEFLSTPTTSRPFFVSPQTSNNTIEKEEIEDLEMSKSTPLPGQNKRRRSSPLKNLSPLVNAIPDTNISPEQKKRCYEDIREQEQDTERKKN